VGGGRYIEVLGDTEIVDGVFCVKKIGEYDEDTVYVSTLNFQVNIADHRDKIPLVLCYMLCVLANVLFMYSNRQLALPTEPHAI
jgi:hypothetical protein